MKKINGDDTMNSLENLLAEGGRRKEKRGSRIR